MSIIWTVLIVASVLYSVANGSPDKIITGISDAASSAITLCINLCGIFAIWSGILEMAKKSGILRALSALSRPVIRFLFKNLNDSAAIEAITTNITANILGIGNAATPAGQRAIKEMNKHNPDKGKATHNMVMLLVLNNSALTLLPTTVLTLRAISGSANAGIILPYAIVASIASTVIAVVLGLIFK